MDLKPKVYPLNCLKAEIVDFTKKRFTTALGIAKQYRSHPENFKIATDAAQQFLNDLGEELYTYQAKQLRQVQLEVYADLPFE